MIGVDFELTDEILKDVEEMAADGMLEKEIAEVLGIHPNTLSHKKAEYEQLAHAIKKGNAKGLKRATKALRSCIEDKEIAAIIYYLKVKHGWKDKEDNKEAMQAIKESLDLMKDEIIRCRNQVSSKT